MGKLYGNKNVFKGNYTSDILFCWFRYLITIKSIAYYVLFMVMLKKGGYKADFVAVRWL